MAEAAKEEPRWDFLVVCASENREVKPGMRTDACHPPAQERQRQEDDYKSEGSLVNIVKLSWGGEGRALTDNFRSIKVTTWARQDGSVCKCACHQAC